MQLILLEKVANLGDLGQVVKVKSGYGRNYLIPQGKAVFATKDNVTLLEEKKAELQAKAADNLAKSQKRAEEIQALKEIVISAHASDEGKLYGSVGAREIANAVTTLGAELAKQEVLLPNGPIRFVGEHEVKLSLHTDVQLTVTITVVGDDK